MKNRFKISGPGVLIAAAFIGPGTVTVCTLAGVTHGYTLLWAMVLSVVATIVLQEMAARIGLISGQDLATVIRQQIPGKSSRFFAILLMLCAIVIGNAAYEAGNISGGVLGLESLGFDATIGWGNYYINGWSFILGGLAAVLLYVGNYKILERVLVAMVLVMSIAFLITAALTRPDIWAIFKGSLWPQIPENGLLMVVAIVGTTVVPYNLFLHASLVNERWKGKAHLAAAKRDTVVAVILGGIVSMAIMICAAALQGTQISNASDLALSLEPLFGDYARYFVGVGLGAAGLTSAITAPLAAAYVVQGCLGWKPNLKGVKFRAVWMSILGIGIIFSSSGYKPIQIIQFAQVANGVLLPVMAGYLIWLANKKQVLGSYVNTKVQNILGICIWCIVLILGLRLIFKVLGIL
ncbi:MAG: manganese transporter [Cytophagaceae bacterium]|nr:manganese transporter [Cytophagaceae bacterium]